MAKYSCYNNDYIGDYSAPACTFSCSVLFLLHRRNTASRNLCNTKSVQTAAAILQYFLPCLAPAEHEAPLTLSALVTGTQAQLALGGAAHQLEGEGTGGRLGVDRLKREQNMFIIIHTIYKGKPFSLIQLKMDSILPQ